MRAIRLTRQTWLALTAAVAFVVLALLIAVLPVPYVVYSPGSAYDILATDDEGQPMIRVEGIPAEPANGKLHMTTVAVTRADARTSLPEAVLAFLLPRRDALPRDAVYDPGKTSEQVRAEERRMMDTSQQDAVVAALRAAEVPVEQLPMISSVTVASPADERLRPGDLVLAVDGAAVTTPEEVATRITGQRAGEPIRFTVEREGRLVNADVVTAENPNSPGRAMIGVEIGLGYRYEPRVNFGISHDIGGPSAGLVFALAIYDQIAPADVLQGRSVAGTGRINPAGRVGPIGGLQEKIASAERADASVFLVPAANCRDLADLRTDLELIRVDTLQDAVTGLQALGNPARAAEVPRC
ncbi:YlbL family protein [Granulicoccus sp. GXG6511]|uniref:YlbL family protein n=1 Tax=Granulicoccus sp. GXG6511 TaxID=3381351 RepID=UPI003D7D2F80